MARHTATLTPPTRTTQSRAGDPARAIVRAAADCFDRWGIERTRVEDIASEVGIARPHVYRHFASKDAIVHAVVISKIEAHHARLARSFPLEGPADDLIVGTLISGIRDAAPDVISLTRSDSARFTAHSLASSPEVVALLQRHWEPVLAYAHDRGELRDEVHIPSAAHWLVFLQFSYLTMPEMLPPGDELDAHLRAFVLPGLLRDTGARGSPT